MPTSLRKGPDPVGTDMSRLKPKAPKQIRYNVSTRPLPVGTAATRIKEPLVKKRPLFVTEKFILESSENGTMPELAANAEGDGAKSPTNCGLDSCGSSHANIVKSLLRLMISSCRRRNARMPSP